MSEKISLCRERGRFTSKDVIDVYVVLQLPLIPSMKIPSTASFRTLLIFDATSKSGSFCSTRSNIFQTFFYADRGYSFSIFMLTTALIKTQRIHVKCSSLIFNKTFHSFRRVKNKATVLFYSDRNLSSGDWHYPRSFTSLGAILKTVWYIWERFKQIVYGIRRKERTRYH